MIRLRARFDGRVLIPEEPVDLPAGALIQVEVTRSDDPPGVGKGVEDFLRAVREPPHLSPEETAELERAIAEGKRPANYTDPLGTD